METAAQRRKSRGIIGELYELQNNQPMSCNSRSWLENDRGMVGGNDEAGPTDHIRLPYVGKMTRSWTGWGTEDCI